MENEANQNWNQPTKRQKVNQSLPPRLLPTSDFYGKRKALTNTRTTSATPATTTSSSWLAARTVLRRKWRRLSQQYETEDNEEEAPQMEIKKVINGIRLLPAGYQQIISLYLIEGYDHIEIGEILNISSSTSKSQYHRAKKKLIEIVKTL